LIGTVAISTRRSNSSCAIMDKIQNPGEKNDAAAGRFLGGFKPGK
jgi:hypothetical protein